MNDLKSRIKTAHFSQAPSSVHGGTNAPEPATKPAATAPATEESHRNKGEITADRHSGVPPTPAESGGGPATPPQKTDVPTHSERKLGSEAAEGLLGNGVVPPYRIPSFRESFPVFAPTAHRPYYSLGHCLRKDFFPGLPQPCRSLFQDSFTPEVSQRSSIDSQHWHGRGTDDLGRWTEKNIAHRQLNKALHELHDRSKTS
ncbi:testis-expressed protein 33 [Acipenser ruthenus]|uniref:testis-expressed protein 33 n=1 Tax=Acipenser ruthenus TaxID=7906 RepID=UPI00274285A0|nr:testis-expressed protein 33 [Acipenser ruthenus]